jgi:hypothetical protein
MSASECQQLPTIPLRSNRKRGAKRRALLVVSNRAPRLLAYCAVLPSTCCSSPLWYISIMMSEPPMNSPLT